MAFTKKRGVKRKHRLTRDKKYTIEKSRDAVANAFVKLYKDKPFDTTEAGLSAIITGMRPTEDSVISAVELLKLYPKKKGYARERKLILSIMRLQRLYDNKMTGGGEVTKLGYYTYTNQTRLTTQEEQKTEATTVINNPFSGFFTDKVVEVVAIGPNSCILKLRNSNNKEVYISEELDANYLTPKKGFFGTIDPMSIGKLAELKSGDEIDLVTIDITKYENINQKFASDVTAAAAAAVPNLLQTPVADPSVVQPPVADPSVVQSSAAAPIDVQAESSEAENAGSGAVAIESTSKNQLYIADVATKVSLVARKAADALAAMKIDVKADAIKKDADAIKKDADVSEEEEDVSDEEEDVSEEEEEEPIVAATLGNIAEVARKVSLTISNVANTLAKFDEVVNEPTSADKDKNKPEHLKQFLSDESVKPVITTGLNKGKTAAINQLSELTIQLNTLTERIKDTDLKGLVKIGKSVTRIRYKIKYIALSKELRKELRDIIILNHTASEDFTREFVLAMNRALVDHSKPLMLDHTSTAAHQTQRTIDEMEKNENILLLGLAASEVAVAVREVAESLKTIKVVGNKDASSTPPTKEDDRKKYDTSEIERLIASAKGEKMEYKPTGPAMEVRNLSAEHPALILTRKNEKQTAEDAFLAFCHKNGLTQKNDEYSSVRKQFLELQIMHDNKTITTADLIHYVHPDEKGKTDFDKLDMVTKFIFTKLDPITQFIQKKFESDVTERNLKEKFMDYVLSLYRLPLADVFRTQLSLFTDQPFEPGIKDDRYPARYANYVKILDVKTYTMYKTRSKSHNATHEDIKDNYRNYVELLNEYVKDKTKPFTNFKDLLSDSIVHMTELVQLMKEETKLLESEYEKAIGWIDKGTMSPDEKKTQTGQLEKLKNQRCESQKNTQLVYSNINDTVKGILLQFDKRKDVYNAKTDWTDKDQLNLILDELQEQLHIKEDCTDGTVDTCRSILAEYYKHVGYGDLNADFKKYTNEKSNLDVEIEAKLNDNKEKAAKDKAAKDTAEEDKAKGEKATNDKDASVDVLGNKNVVAASVTAANATLRTGFNAGITGIQQMFTGGKDEKKDLEKLGMEKIAITKEFDDKRRFLETAILDLSEVREFDESSYIAYLKLQKLFKILRDENKYVLHKYFDIVTKPTFGEFDANFITNYFAAKVQKYKDEKTTQITWAIDTLIDNLLSEPKNENNELLINRLHCYKVFCLGKKRIGTTCSDKNLYSSGIMSFAKQLEGKQVTYEEVVEIILEKYKTCNSLTSIKLSPVVDADLNNPENLTKVDDAITQLLNDPAIVNDKLKLQLNQYKLYIKKLQPIKPVGGKRKKLKQTLKRKTAGGVFTKKNRVSPITEDLQDQGFVTQSSDKYSAYETYAGFGEYLETAADTNTNKSVKLILDNFRGNEMKYLAVKSDKPSKTKTFIEEISVKIYQLQNAQVRNDNDELLLKRLKCFKSFYVTDPNAKFTYTGLVNDDFPCDSIELYVSFESQLKGAKLMLVLKAYKERVPESEVDKPKPLIIRPNFDTTIESDLQMIGYDKSEVSVESAAELLIITINKSGLTINDEHIESKYLWNAARKKYLGYEKSPDDFELPIYADGELKFIIDLQEKKIAAYINGSKEILINNTKQLDEFKSAVNRVKKSIFSFR